MRPSRTYKLRLSDEGIDLFLHCHDRLARLRRDFIPYGATLATAVAMLDNREPREIIAELGTLRFSRCLGDQVRFVGTSIALSPMIAKLTSRLAVAKGHGRMPTSGHLYIVGLLTIKSAADDALQGTCEQILK